MVEYENIIADAKKFLARSSKRFSGDLESQKDALEISGGNFWNDTRKNEWQFVGKNGKDLCPTIAYNNIQTQCDAIASPFSKSPFHVNICDKMGMENVQEAIAELEAKEQAKVQYQKAFTRGIICGSGYIVIGTEEGKAANTIVPNIEFISQQASVAFDPDCVTASGEDAEEGAIVSYIAIKKARRMYGVDVIPEGIEHTGLMTLGNTDCWGSKSDKVQVVRYFAKETEADDKINVHCYTIVANQVVEDIPMGTSIIPIVRFAGYNCYDETYGEVYTGWVQKNLPQITEISLAKTIQAMRMRRNSNVRILTDVRSIEGCESYFQNFEKGSSLILAYNGEKGNAPVTMNDTFQTADVQAVISEGRQSLADMTGINPSGIDTREKTAYEVMQQQTNSESNVQSLYINAQMACHTIARIMIEILGGGNAKFTLEGGPDVITTKMKKRQEIKAISDMANNTAMKDRCAIELAALYGDNYDALIEDLKANSNLKFAEESIGTITNAAEAMKGQLEQANQIMQEKDTENNELKQQVASLNLAMQNQKEQFALQMQKMQLDAKQQEFEMQMREREFNLKIAELQSKNAQASTKNEIEAIKAGI